MRTDEAHAGTIESRQGDDQMSTDSIALVAEATWKGRKRTVWWFQGRLGGDPEWIGTIEDHLGDAATILLDPMATLAIIERSLLVPVLMVVTDREGMRSLRIQPEEASQAVPA